MLHMQAHTKQWQQRKTNKAKVLYQVEQINDLNLCVSSCLSHQNQQTGVLLNVCYNVLFTYH